MSIQEQFEAAVKVIRSLPKNGSFQPSNEMKLKFYALFKQATEGPNQTKRPAFYDMVNRYKWDAWNQCGQMSREEAMRLYVEELKKVVETISLTDEVTDFLDMLGPFYEFLPEEVKASGEADGQPPPLDTVAEPPPGAEPARTTAGHNNCRSYDSDGDEFADTYDSTPRDDAGVQLFRAPAGGGQPVPGAPAGPPLPFNEQLAVAIFQLQSGLDRLSDRVRVLETAAAPAPAALFPHGWPSTAFFLAWPVVIFFALNYLNRIRKK